MHQLNVHVLAGGGHDDDGGAEQRDLAKNMIDSNYGFPFLLCCCISLLFYKYVLKTSNNFGEV